MGVKSDFDFGRDEMEEAFVRGDNGARRCVAFLFELLASFRRKTFGSEEIFSFNFPKVDSVLRPVFWDNFVGFG